jgi:hypothetical protein
MMKLSLAPLWQKLEEGREAQKEENLSFGQQIAELKK